MSVFCSFEREFSLILERLFSTGVLKQRVDSSQVVFEFPRNDKHGDLSSNAAMVLADELDLKPHDLAKTLARELKSLEGVEEVKIAGPGFLNLKLFPLVWQKEVIKILKDGENFGKNNIGSGAPINVEFVSANPTGPLHAAHARGAVFGDVLSNLLEFCGWVVTREYYVNDAGKQVDLLARSTYLRYCEALGKDIGAIPAGLYPGAYLKEIGSKLAQEVGSRYLDTSEENWLEKVRTFAIRHIMAGIKDDLNLLGIKMDLFSSEKQLVLSGAVEHAIESLDKQGFLYQGTLDPPKGKEPEDWEPREQLLFRATDFGDDTDRPLKKSDGSWTYFATDVAYHLNKLERTNGKLINIFGADHGGYVKRMKAATVALSGDKAALDIKICQLVHLLDKGQPVKMSKRAGTFVTLEDVIKAVGSDVIRFIMLTRRNDQTLDFDFAKVMEQSRDNPVFYVQYAHARISSILRQFDNDGNAIKEGKNLELLTNSHEIKLIKTLASWPKMVKTAGKTHEPHRLAFFLTDLAAIFHSLWNAGRENQELRFLIPENPQVTNARMQMLKAASLVIRSGLNVLSIKALDKM